MKPITISSDYCFDDEDFLAQQADALMPLMKYINEVRHDYSTPYAFLHALDDAVMIQQICDVAQQKKELDPAMIIIIGIGGSQLGTLALVQALFGITYQWTVKPELWFVDTVDATYVHEVFKRAEHFLKTGQSVLINGVTQSGTTTETIANLEFFVALLKRYNPEEFRNYIVITTNDTSPLARLARQEHWTLLPVAHMVGGRFSVFSAVGLFVSFLLNISVEVLLEGARQAVADCLQVYDRERNKALQLATIRFYYYSQGIRIHDMFLFASSFIGIGNWYRQLVGESLGKTYNIDNQEIYAGITPTVSVGSADLHSVGQLYLGGPRDKLFCFFELETVEHDPRVPQMPQFDSCITNIQGVAFSHIMRAIMQGVQQAYANDRRPFFSIRVPEMSAYYCGYLLQLFMMEIVYLGHLMRVNPFDQPQVEAYKHKTRRILAYE